MKTPKQYSTTAKPRFPRPVAIQAAREVVARLEPNCERIIVAGSLRRGKREVGDVEILYIPKMRPALSQSDFFSIEDINLADSAIEEMESYGTLSRRLNKNGSPSYGPKNKLMRHEGTGVPVDLFSTTAAAWFNYLVCRTGPAESNIEVAKAAQAKGWKWHPYGEGFSDHRGRPVRVCIEPDVFTLVGLPYYEPRERGLYNATKATA